MHEVSNKLCYRRTKIIQKNRTDYVDLVNYDLTSASLKDACLLNALYKEFVLSLLITQILYYNNTEIF